MTLISPGPGSTPVAAGSVTDRVYADLAPISGPDASLGYALFYYIQALCDMFQDVADLAESQPDGSPGWSIVFTNIPVEGLPWQGQFVGVKVDTTQSESAQRNQISIHEQWKRGTPQAIRDALNPLLLGTKAIVILERDTSPYHYTVETYADETPTDSFYSSVYSTYATYSAIYTGPATYQLIFMSGVRAVIIDIITVQTKPAGLQVTYTVLPGHP